MKEHWFLPEKQREEYLKVCSEASENDEKFANFRREPIYQMIVDNGNEQGAKRLLEYVKSNYPNILKFFNILKSIDNFGNPVIYESVGYSNTYLRYMKILGEINEYFKDMDCFENQSVIEIGGGFGGLGIMFFQIFNLFYYKIFDLPEAQLLQKRFLKEYNLFHNPIDSVNLSQMKYIGNYDLVISVCAYSELSRELQDEYIDKVISKAKYGYFHLNNGVEEQANYLRSRLKDKEIITRDIFSREPINQSLFMFKPKN